MNNLVGNVYEEAILFEKDLTITIDERVCSCKIGKHAIWIPGLPGKIIWSHNGQIESYKDWDKGRNCEAILDQKFNCSPGFTNETLKSFMNEYTIFELLAEEGMSPPIGRFFYIKNMISDMPKKGYCDCKGVYGYLMQDASLMSEGNFSPWTFEEKFVVSGKIELSSGALGDVGKDNNTVNGYLIDIRRTIWDMMKINVYGELNPDLLRIHEDKSQLKKKILELGQFPYKERSQGYQTYFLDGKYIEGTRDTLYRFDKMEIEKDLTGKTVLDLGCQIGSMAAETYLRGARFVTGIDNEKDYISCARDLARMNGMQINYLQMNLMKSEDIIEWANDFYQDKEIDILFALALYKHIGENLWILLEKLNWKTCYVESHNAPDGIETGHVEEMIQGMNRISDHKIYPLGMVEDRSPRYIWRLER